MKKFPFWRLIFFMYAWQLLGGRCTFYSISEIKITIYRGLIKPSNVDFFLIYLFMHCFSLYGNPSTKAKLSWSIQRWEDSPGFGLVPSLGVWGPGGLAQKVAHSHFMEEKFIQPLCVSRSCWNWLSHKDCKPKAKMQFQWYSHLPGRLRFLCIQ